jgi:hypothetical protein
MDPHTSGTAGAGGAGGAGLRGAIISLGVRWKAQSPPPPHVFIGRPTAFRTALQENSCLGVPEADYLLRDPWTEPLARILQIAVAENTVGPWGQSSFELPNSMPPSMHPQNYPGWLYPGAKCAPEADIYAGQKGPEHHSETVDALFAPGQRTYGLLDQDRAKRVYVGLVRILSRTAHGFWTPQGVLDAHWWRTNSTPWADGGALPGPLEAWEPWWLPLESVHFLAACLNWMWELLFRNKIPVVTWFNWVWPLVIAKIINLTISL